jgi:tetratricopeptide (TPR) repeat protein
VTAVASGAQLALFLAVAAPLAPQAERPGREAPDQLEVFRAGEGVVDGYVAAGLRLGPGRAAPIAEALRAGDYARAEALLVEAAEARPEAADVLRLLGGVFFLRGRPLNAAVALKKAEAIEPLDERSRFTLVMSYVVLGRRDWARPELETLIRAAPGNPLYVYWTARLDYDDGQYAEAVEHLLRAIDLDPGFAKAHDNLGLCYEALGRFEDAVRSFEEAIRLNRESRPRSPWPTLNLGLLLIRLDRLDEAEARFREAARADPGFPQAHYQLGLVLDKTGRAREAVPELEEAARLDESYAEPHFALARLYRRAGDREKAQRALERFQRIKDAQAEADAASR